jgi:hypothetical protein
MRKHIHSALSAPVVQKHRPRHATANTNSATTRPAGKRRAYHHGMLREDVSGRFDYLFEPLEADESAGDGDDAATSAFPQPADDGRWSRRIVLTGAVLATLAAAAATVVVLLQPARPTRPVVAPTDATLLPMARSTAPSAAMPTPTESPVPVLPATVSTSAARPPSPQPSVAAPAPPAAPPSPAPSAPPATMPPPPTTRAPISVSPQTRAPFPHQNPPRKNDGGGGLLGGLGGLL